MLKFLARSSERAHGNKTFGRFHSTATTKNGTGIDRPSPVLVFLDTDGLAHSRSDHRGPRAELGKQQKRSFNLESLIDDFIATI